MVNGVQEANIQAGIKAEILAEILPKNHKQSLLSKHLQYDHQGTSLESSCFGLLNEYF